MTSRTFSFLSFFLWIFCIALAPTASAQWTQTNGPYGGQITSLASNGNFLFAATFEGLFRSSNGGTSWMPLTNIPITEGIYSLVVNGSEVFVGGDSSVFHSNDNGSTWTRNNENFSGILSLAMLSDQSIVAGTDASGIILSTDDGATWSFAGVATAEVLSMASIDSHYFAATTNGFFGSTDSGKTWNAIPSGFAGSSLVSTLTANGSSLFLGTEDGFVFSTIDDGAHWSQLATGEDIGQTVLSLAFNQGVLYAGTAQGGIYEWNGSLWSKDTVGPDDGFNALGQVPGGILAAGGGHLYRTTDAGSSWAVSDTGITSVEVLALTTNGTTDPIYYVSTGNDRDFRSTDNGASWQQLNFPIFITDDIGAFQTVGPILLAGTYANAVLASTDNGLSWSHDTAGISPESNCYNFALDGQYLYMANSGFQTGTEDSEWWGIFRSIDSGKSWTWITAPALYDSSIFSVAARNGNVILGDMYNTGILRSTDNGTTWNLANRGVTGDYIHCATPSGTNFLVGTDSGAFRSTDDGDTWVATGLNGISVNAIADSGSLLVAGTQSGVFLSQDNGSTWKDITFDLLDSAINSVSFSGTELLVGSYHGVSKINLANLLSQNSVSILAANIETFSAYPNPAVQSTTLECFTRISGTATVTIVNQLGVKVADVFSGEIEAGEHSFQWNVPAGIPIGVYECVVRMNGQVQEVPLLLKN